MKKIFLLLLFFTKIIYAACSLSFSSANLGTYNVSSGNSVVELFNSNCDYNNLAALSGSTTYTTITNAASGWSIQVNLSYSFYDSNHNITVLPPSSGSINGTFPWILNAGNGSFSSTVSVASGANLLPAGTYNGSITVYQGICDANCWTYVPYTFNISMNVAASCTFSSSGISFGSISGGNAASVNGTISSTCTNGTTYTLTADSGISNNIAARTMKNGVNILNYNLYVDSGRTLIWGGGVYGNTISLTGSGTTQSTTIYGQIPSGQRPTPGTYSDTVNVTITY